MSEKGQNGEGYGLEIGDRFENILLFAVVRED